MKTLLAILLGVVVAGCTPPPEECGLFNCGSGGTSGNGGTQAGSNGTAGTGAMAGSGGSMGGSSGGSGGNAGTAGGGATGAMGGSAGAAGTAGTGGSGATGGTAGTGGSAPVCQPITLEHAGLDMFLAIDKSGSMQDNNKWILTHFAFDSFFQDPKNAAANISVALRFWPDGQCSELTCSVDACAAPQVSLGPLSSPTQQFMLKTLYDSKFPGGNTPMYPALGGATQWSTAHLSETESVTAILFMTDGEPNGCNEDIIAIAQLALSAAGAGVRTYAVGLPGSNPDHIQLIAALAGTKPYNIGLGAIEREVGAAVADAVADAVACEFVGPGVDPGSLTVTVQETMAVAVQVPSGQDCDGAGDVAWYMSAASHVVACPKLCADIRGKAATVQFCSL